jgi:glycosyltransferase involved in cell wall biosynthesis
MRILFDHQIFVMQKFGGISRYFNEIMQMQKHGVQVEKINPDLFKKTTPEPKYDLLSRGIRFLKRKYGFEKKKEIKFPEAAGKIFSEESFDIFHPTYYDPYFLSLSSKPFVLTVYDMIHEIYREYYPLSDNTSHNKRLLCQKAEQVIAISNSTKNDILEIFKLPEEKVHAIQLASDFDKVISSMPLNTEQLTNYVLFTGAREGYKNFYFAATALADLLKADKSLQLLCTGHEFSKDELLFFDDLGISGQVYHLFLKNDQELAWAYQNASLFIFPSLYEGFGFPLLEAFASNCPVISSRGGSLLEIGGDAALYFDPKNINQIRDAAASVLYDAANRSLLVKKGQLQFSKFSWDVCRNKTIAVYNQALNN